MNNKRLDLIGHKYNMLTVIKELPTEGHSRRFECRCDCGNITKVFMTNLRKTKSCGCAHVNTRTRKKITVKSKDLLMIEKVFHTLSITTSSIKITKVDDWRLQVFAILTNYYTAVKLNNLKREIRKTLKNKNVWIKLETRVPPQKIFKNKEGLTGIFWSQSQEKWVAQMSVKGDVFVIGSYLTLEDATYFLNKQTLLKVAMKGDYLFNREDYEV